MIAFGCSIISPDAYVQYAEPGLERVRESDSRILAHAAANSIARGLNVMMERAAALDGLEALVVVHQDVEIVDPEFCAKVRAALRDPAVGVVGCVGALGTRDMAWWDGRLSWTSAPYRYSEFGGGELDWIDDGSAASRAPGEVDSLYGVVLVLSPWAVQNLRLDESIGLLHGYDFDLCHQARAAGRKVLAADLKVVHHHELELIGQVEMWVEAHMRMAATLGAGPSAGEDEEAYWKARARRAEADAAAARLLAASRLLQAGATMQVQERGLETVLGSRSWKLTQPLRRAGLLARDARGRGRRRRTPRGQL
ncbi:MAG TPA: glycosyltransferase [Solirubrobacteraceae bacterium]|nr:glycosyltransferase [Solirubrobacteraceae bacterium]